MRLHPPRPGPRIASTAGLQPGPSGQRRERHLRRCWRPGRTWLVAAGLGCLAAVLVLGVVVAHGATPIDQAAYRDLHIVLSQHRLVRGVAGAVAHERGRWHGSYVTAALPLLLAAILAAGKLGTLRRDRWRMPRGLGLRAWRWLAWSCILLGSVPLVEALRLAFDRPDPTESANPRSPLGSYPSGAALLVALGWIVGGTVIVRLRPSWRRPLLAAGALALAVHAAARVAVGAHWLTDVLGSYLLAAGMALLAAAAAAA